jgi:hypothetical protein
MTKCPDCPMCGGQAAEWAEWVPNSTWLRCQRCGWDWTESGKDKKIVDNDVWLCSHPEPWECTEDVHMHTSTTEEDGTPHVSGCGCSSCTYEYWLLKR